MFELSKVDYPILTSNYIVEKQEDSPFQLYVQFVSNDKKTRIFIDFTKSQMKYWYEVGHTATYMSLGLLDELNKLCKEVRNIQRKIQHRGRR